MKRFIPYITFIYFTLSAATCGLTVMAGNCNSYENKLSEKKCDKDDTDCQTNKTEKIDFNETIKS